MPDGAAAIDLANDVIRALDGYTTKAELARITGMAPSNLGRLLRGARTPRRTTVRALVDGVDDLLSRYDAQLPDDQLSEFRRRRDLIETAADDAGTVGPRAAPGGPLPAPSPVYVPRPVDADIDARVEAGQGFEIVGPPASGRSSALVHAAQRARARHIDVLAIDLAPLAVAPDRALHHLIHAVTTRVPGELRPASLVDAPQRTLIDAIVEGLDAWTRLDARPRLILLDGFNLLPLELAAEIEATLRELSAQRTGRARFSYGATSSSPSWTSPAAQPARSDASTVATSTVETGWLDPSGIDHLVAAYRARTLPGRARNLETTGREAWQLFAGQPLLTHQYVHDHGLETVPPQDRSARIWDARSPYRTHLRVLEHLAPPPVDTAEGGRAITIRPPHGPPPRLLRRAGAAGPTHYDTADDRALRSLGLVEGADGPWRPEHQWRSWYYSAWFSRRG